jgi:hypothetical protein
MRVKLIRANLQSLASTRDTSTRRANAINYVILLRTAVAVTAAAVAAVVALLLLLHLLPAKIQRITCSQLKLLLMVAASCLQILELSLLESLLSAISGLLENVPRLWLFYNYWTSKEVLPPANT